MLIASMPSSTSSGSMLIVTPPSSGGQTRRDRTALEGGVWPDDDTEDSAYHDALRYKAQVEGCFDYLDDREDQSVFDPLTLDSDMVSRAAVDTLSAEKNGINHDTALNDNTALNGNTALNDMVSVKVPAAVAAEWIAKGVGVPVPKHVAWDTHNTFYSKPDSVYQEAKARIAFHGKPLREKGAATTQDDMQTPIARGGEWTDEDDVWYANNELIHGKALNPHQRIPGNNLDALSTAELGDTDTNLVINHAVPTVRDDMKNGKQFRVPLSEWIVDSAKPAAMHKPKTKVSTVKKLGAAASKKTPNKKKETSGGEEKANGCSKIRGANSKKTNCGLWSNGDTEIHDNEAEPEDTAQYYRNTFADYYDTHGLSPWNNKVPIPWGSSSITERSDIWSSPGVSPPFVPPVSKNITVTYWATVESAGKKFNIPIDSNNVSGVEKTVINTDMKKVWEWVVKKGLEAQISLDGAYELAKEMHNKDDDVDKHIGDNKFVGYIPSRSTSSISKGSWGGDNLRSRFHGRDPDPESGYYMAR
ncbi:hypothetical protein K504DRAFT_177725 [Pleomassaria siparia CBS 279.74]|uniref:Uncharacterized protein n=1 Tax=Pleomassaria siparia CBS 279.74 TaxID=1314801 RepID=A0A6G1JS25_9PLEO|nr:hypothetical protein K504DRAFT_177725 [Pleomassaria siparia CBS 279.74]